MMSYIDRLLKYPTDSDLMNALFDNFGTHSIQKAEMGDKFVAKTEMSRHELFKKKEMGMKVNFSASGGWEFSDADVDTSHEYNSDSEQHSKDTMDKATYYTIGTPLPQGADLKAKLEGWIGKRENIEANPQPVGQLKLLTLPETLQYAFEHEGLTSPAHKALLASLTRHLKSDYCQHLVTIGTLENCDAPTPLKPVPITKRRVPGSDIRGKYGESTMCPADGIVTEQCGAGAYADCNGFHTTGHCAKFETNHENGRG